MTISGTLSRGSDNDYFLVSVAPGKSLNITLTPNASLGSALGLYQANGKLLRLLSGFPGQVQRLQMKNPGSSSMSFAVRVLRSGGKAGAYQLALEH